MIELGLFVLATSYEPPQHRGDRAAGEGLGGAPSRRRVLECILRYLDYATIFTPYECFDSDISSLSTHLASAPHTYRTHHVQSAAHAPKPPAAAPDRVAARTLSSRFQITPHDLRPP